MSDDPLIKREVAAPKRGFVTKYPIKDMRLGDSFFVRLGRRTPESVTAAIYASIRNFKAKHPQIELEFMVGRRREKGFEGVRCWRIR